MATTNFTTGTTITADWLNDVDALVYEGVFSSDLSVTGDVTITTNSTNSALTVTQTGSGNCFVVEDVASDTTPFVIDALGSLQINTSPSAKAEQRYSVQIDRNDTYDNLATTGLTGFDEGLRVYATRGANCGTAIRGINCIVTNQSTHTDEKSMTAIYGYGVCESGSKGNSFAGVFEGDYLHSDTSFTVVEVNCGANGAVTYTDGGLMNLIAGTDYSTSAGNTQNATVPLGLRIKTAPISTASRTWANLETAIKIDEGDANSTITYILDAPGYLLAQNTLTLGTTNTAFDIIHKDDDRQLSINGSNSSGSGGNIILYGSAHATKAQQLELKAGTNLIATIGTNSCTFNKPFRYPSYTVATLPTPANYMAAIVTDANATTFASIVAGGGSNIVPVYYDGTNWRIG